MSILLTKSLSNSVNGSLYVDQIDPFRTYTFKKGHLVTELYFRTWRVVGQEVAGGDRIYPSGQLLSVGFGQNGGPRSP